MAPYPRLFCSTSFLFQRSRNPILRNTVQRRFASGGEPSTKLVGPMDNAFNRDRLAVREHAAQSAGMQNESCLTQTDTHPFD